MRVDNDLQLMFLKRNMLSSDAVALHEGDPMNREGVDKFEKIAGQLLSTYEEMSLLSKKNPNDAVNKFKLKFINSQIADCNDFLLDKYKPLTDFEQFIEDDVPQNSDVVFILSQYLQAFEKLRADNIVVRTGLWHWKIEVGKEDKNAENGFIFIRTVKPKNLRD